MQLIPPYLLVFLGVGIVLPSVFAIGLRIALYRKITRINKVLIRLVNGAPSGRIPELLEELEFRYKQSSVKLENVNSSALIDLVYSRQRIGWLSWESAEQLGRGLPNLLIALGLLGTFLGISLNLYALNQAIANNTSIQIGAILPQIQKQLQGMGIAFSSSLIAISFSALLTVFNWLFNIDIVKNQLLVLIEDYLDNVYKPEIPGHTRIDRAVDRLVDEFSGFLYRFGDTVRGAVENSLGDKIQELVDLNKDATILANQIYTGLQSSSSTMSKSSSEMQHSIATFENAIASLNRTLNTFEQSFQKWQRANVPHKLLEATTNLSIHQQKYTQSLKEVQMSFLEASLMPDNIQKIEAQLSVTNRILMRLLDNFSDEPEPKLSQVEIAESDGIVLDNNSYPAVDLNIKPEKLA